LTIRANLLHPELTSSLTLVIQPDAQPSRQVEVPVPKDSEITAAFDLAINGFSPFSRIYYWFEASLNDGTIKTSASYWFDYIDNRYDWKSNSTNLFTINWVNGDTTYGQKLQSIARSGMERSTQLLPIVPKLPVIIYVYPDIPSLQSVLSLDAQSWVNGHTIVNTNIILVADSPSLEDTTDLERILPHEIMHLLQFQLMNTTYSNAPHWLLEGLATKSELYANPDLEREFTAAKSTNSLIPLSDLCFGFSNDANQATLAYAQAASVVTYIQNRFSNQALLTMLQNSIAGLDCDQSTKSALGITSQQLELDWKASLSDEQSATPYKLALWIGVPIFALIVGVLIWNIRKRQVNDIQED
jgi:hypothetical protein